jgi:hypothetical protein
MALDPKIIAFKLTEADQPYWQSLGRFISVYSKLEANLQTALWHFSGTPPEIARSVFSGTRVDQALSSIRRIGEAQKWSDAKMERWSKISQQVSIITKVRNDIVHYGATFDGEKHQFSNELLAHTPETLRQYDVSAAVIDDLALDTIHLIGHVVMFAWGLEIPPHVAKKFEGALGFAWRYKPTAPKHPQNKHQKPRSKRPPPP